MNGPWLDVELKEFLQANDRFTAENLARHVGRTKPAIMGMRRKLKRLRELGASERQLLVLLRVSNGFVDTHTLTQIKQRAVEDLVHVRPFVRRSRYNGKPHLVGPYKRNKETP